MSFTFGLIGKYDIVQSFNAIPKLGLFYSILSIRSFYVIACRAFIDYVFVSFDNTAVQSHHKFLNKFIWLPKLKIFMKLILMTVIILVPRSYFVYFRDYDQNC